MQLTHLLLQKISQDYSHLSFKEGESFYWHPETRTITYIIEDAHGAEHLLHELAHAILDHKEYKADIELIQLERLAWEYAKSTLGPAYVVSINDEIIQQDLDTYRDWLHARSSCPQCHAVGLQQKSLEYHCSVCGQVWKANQAFTTELRRYKK